MVVSVKKVSVYLDEKTWNKFKASVFAKHGSLRYLSQEVETILRSEDAENALTSLSDKMGLNATGLITSSDIKKNRPKSRGPPSEEIIREMRQNRHAKVAC
jgi:hypothetical protein